MLAPIRVDQHKSGCPIDSLHVYVYFFLKQTGFYTNVTIYINRESPGDQSEAPRFWSCYSVFLFHGHSRTGIFRGLPTSGNTLLGVYMSRDLLQSGSTFLSTFMLWRFHPKCRVGRSWILAFGLLPSFSSQGALSFCFE